MSGRDFRECVVNRAHVYEDSIGAPWKCCGVAVAGVAFGGAATEEEVAEMQGCAIRWARDRHRCVSCHRDLMHATFWAEAWETYATEGRCPRCGPLAPASGEATNGPASLPRPEAPPSPLVPAPRSTNGDDR